MKSRKKKAGMLLLMLSVGLLASSAAVFFTAGAMERVQFAVLGEICGDILTEAPGAEQAVLAVLKKYKDARMTGIHEGDVYAAGKGENILSEYGYRQSDFAGAGRYIWLYAAAGSGVGTVLFLSVFFYWKGRQKRYIRTLTGYLEQVNAGNAGILSGIEENDEFAGLQDEIYKTVTALHRKTEEAVEAGKHFAENLSNIAHQLKTPITAISLSAQMMREIPSAEYINRIERQVHRLTHLEEALLVLARIDAGTLCLQKQKTDVFTLLTLAADNLQELFSTAGVFIDISEAEQAEITVDLEWTMEAVMNLMKNCLEHTPAGGTVYCDYEQNLLYTRICIWDEGDGFAEEDLPHLFDRFYRGENAGEGGIGIGLSLARELMEMQNGVVSAGNRKAGGAFFEIRIYSH